MNSVLLGTGLACLIGAIVGGGMKGFGVELPLLQSLRRQVLLAAVGLVLIGASAADKIQTLFSLAERVAGPAVPAPVNTLPPANTAVINDGGDDGGPKQPKHAPHVTPRVVATATSAANDVEIATLKSELEGVNNRIAVARESGQMTDCEAERARLAPIQHALAASYAKYHITYVPNDIKNPPPPDPCTHPDGAPAVRFGGP